MTGRQRSLLIEEPPLQIIPGLAKEIGLNEAIILQQIHYWLQRSENDRDGRKWVYKSTQEWAHEFPFWSEATIKRAISNLRAKALIIVTKRSATSWERVNWYTVDYESLSRIGSKCTDASAQPDSVHHGKVPRSNGSKRSDRSDQSAPHALTTETTSETTTKTHARPGENYDPPAEVVAWAKARGFELFLPLHVEQFRDTCTTQQRKPYTLSGLDAAFRKCVREDWGGVRRQAQMAARFGQPSGVVQSPVSKVCAYCGEPSTGNVNRIEYCNTHSLDAMDQKPRPVAAGAHA